MWNRSKLKEKAKLGVKRNYWKTVLVALLSALAVGGFAVAGGVSHSFASMPDTQSIFGNLPIDAPQNLAVANSISPAFWMLLSVFAIQSMVHRRQQFICNNKPCIIPQFKRRRQKNAVYRNL